MATCIDISKIKYPEKYNDTTIIPLEGKSLLPIFEGKERKTNDYYCFQLGNSVAIRKEKWKLTGYRNTKWELYNIENDRTELYNIADLHLEIANNMDSIYNEWVKKVGAKEKGNN